MDAPPPSGSTSRLAFAGAVLVGKYRLDRVIGHGTHLGLNQQIALKLVSSVLTRSSEGLRRFDNEAKAAAQIKSRHVAQVYDNGVLEDGTPYLAMELLQGETLFTRVHRGGPVPLPEAVVILEHCCRALGRAHALGIVHRDIKPENIFLAQSVDDDTLVAKILDFGIAKITVLDSGEHSATRTGSLLGTPMYMSPEQARGLRSIDHRTDLYSLGLVSYMMFTGNLAFGGETLGELLLQICTQPLPSLLLNARWLPPAMEGWFQRACAREPDQRFPTAQAFAEALRIAAGISSPGPAPMLDAPGPNLPRPPMHSTPVPQNTPTTQWSDPSRLAVPQASSTTGPVVGAESSPAARPARRRALALVAAAILGLVISIIAAIVFVKSTTAGARGSASTTAPTVSAATTATSGMAAPSASSLALEPAATASEAPSGSAAIAPPPKPLALGQTNRPATPVPAVTATATATTTPPSKPPGKPGTVDLGY